jgi:hypothetical protein
MLRGIVPADREWDPGRVVTDGWLSVCASSNAPDASNSMLAERTREIKGNWTCGLIDMSPSDREGSGVGSGLDPRRLRWGTTGETESNSTILDGRGGGTGVGKVVCALAGRVGGLGV